MVAHAVGAQGTAPDSTPVLSPVVVVAERAPTAISQSTAAVTRLTAADLARIPHATLADALRMVSGIAIVDFDGNGRMPQVMARGFYGGGETDYVVVLVDGHSVNRAENGTVAWDALPPVSAIESIEIVRGNASAAHGDAAVGGVISIVTRRRGGGLSWEASGGGLESIAAAAEVPATLGTVPLHVDAAFDRTNGYRRRSRHLVRSVTARLDPSPSTSVSIRTANRDFEDPGPLVENVLAQNRMTTMVRDHTNDTEGGLSLSDTRSSGSTTRTFSLDAGARRAVVRRTLPLSPAFLDTKERTISTVQLGATLQLDREGTPLPGDDRLTAGATINAGSVDSRYFEVDSDSHERGAEVAGGDGQRHAYAVFAHWAAHLHPAIRVTLGTRADWQSDRHDNRSETVAASHKASSSSAGLNVRLFNRAAGAGHLYVSVSQTFKAPTLDQLFDQRPIPIPFPPFSVTTSNALLHPQRGHGFEAGLYHDLRAGAARVHVAANAYQTDMRDELDFDVNTFRYVNIAQSRHRGLESAVSVSSGIVSAFLNVARQHVTARAGDNSGNRLKAVPGMVLSTGVSLTPALMHLGIAATRVSDMYIDDANTRRIPSWTRIDGQLSRRFGAFELLLAARNLFDARYNTTGFLDASGSGEAWWYPAAGRVLTLGVRHGR
jgi:outer membrane cobalamin receptor